MPDHTHVLLATLGGQPQVVTFTLDLLLQEGFPISEVYVVHPRASHERLKRSLARLSAEFVSDSYRAAGRVIHFHSQMLQLDGQAIDDIRDDAHADGTLDTLHQLIWHLKRQGRRIHLSVSGGRRLMALFAISVASLNFERIALLFNSYAPQELEKIYFEQAPTELVIDLYAALRTYTSSTKWTQQEGSPSLRVILVVNS